MRAIKVGSCAVASMIAVALACSSGSGTKTNSGQGGVAGQLGGAPSSGGSVGVSAGTGGSGGTMTSVGGSTGGMMTTVGGGGTTTGGGGVGGSTGGSGGTPVVGGGGSGGSSAAGTGGNAGAGGDGAGGSTGVGCAGAALCWDFEGGAIPQGWSMTLRTADYSGSIAVDMSKPKNGMYSLHMAGLTGGTVAGMDGGPKRSMQYTLPPNFGPVMWGRAFVYTSPEAPVSHAGFFNARYPVSADTSWTALDWYEVAAYQQNYMSIWHTPEPPGFPEWVKKSDTPFVVNAWTCVEWLFDAQNGNATVAADPRVWLNGTELNWPTEFTFDNSGTDKPTPPAMVKGTNFTMIETGAWFYQGVVTPTDYWIDDLAIGPDRIGCNP
ncbi:MAG TPA: hypothetical protein VL137_01910 [Polyangiaceae bacterium]|nr:hypothetical protein [Polyangiaceae bacterium]